jgi:TetR/AcrR family transcriptional repressor of mexJK operon
MANKNGPEKGTKDNITSIGLDSPKTTREKILSAMYTLVAEKGYDKASISQICAMVNITKPSLYYYFPSKEDLFIELSGDLYPIVEHEPETLSTIHTKEEFKNYLLDLGHGIINSYKEDESRRRFLAEIEIQATRIPKLAKQQEISQETVIDALAAILQRGVDIGALPENFNINRSAQFLYVLILGFSSGVTRHWSVDTNEVWNYAVNILLEG